MYKTRILDGMRGGQGLIWPHTSQELADLSIGSGDPQGLPLSSHHQIW